MREMATDYLSFLSTKAPRPLPSGIDPMPMPGHLFDYQVHSTAFCLRQGRAALFLDTGLGKTVCELEWAQQARRAANGRALILTPLAVARQIEREGLRFDYPIRVIREQSDAGEGINVCNYDRLAKLDTSAWDVVVLDESSVLKSFTGVTTRSLITSFSHARFRLCATATPAPNDHAELGQHAEFLGIMDRGEMLQRWFINDTSTASQQWRLKRHGEQDFWDWMASWSRCASGPEDLGYDGSRFALPPLEIHRHKVAGDTRPAAGMLFAGDVSATNMFDIKRQTAEARADVIADLVTNEPGHAWVIWCDTDQESSALAYRLPFALEIRGSHSIDVKEDRLAAFVNGEARALISKPSICGYGCNWQHADRMAFVGRSFSYEAWYQAVRRCWRFGQMRAVHVHLAVAEGEDQIGRVIERKADDHRRMKEAMAAAMQRGRSSSADKKVPYNPTYMGRLPAWLSAA